MDFMASLSGCWEEETDGTKLHATLPALLESTPPKMWDALRDFVSLPYWFRTWTLQEIAQGTAKMRVLYADKQVKRLDVNHAAVYFNVPHRPDALGDAVEAIMRCFPDHWAAADQALRRIYYYAMQVSNAESLRQKHV